MKKNLGLYLHIPFCIQKCQYCDFLSFPGDDPVRDAYVEKLTGEIEEKSGIYREYQVSTVFLGGGTPSLLDGEQAERILKAVHKGFSLSEDAEITMECNPGTVTAGKLEAYRRAGFNRLSLGLQSVRDTELKLLGRIHSFSDFLHTYDLVRWAGFDNVNLDLMSGLPGQKVADWADTLRQVCRLRPEHISAYGLLIEEGTPFYDQYGAEELRREAGEETALLPDEETDRAMYDMTGEILASQGYRQYEISNYARPGKECRHNIGCWTRENYLGLGLGSASLVENVRFSNTDSLPEYLNGGWDPQNREELGRRAQMEEFMFLGLRMRCGVSRRRFREIFGTELECIYGAQIKKFMGQGLLDQKAGSLFLTREGISVSNYVMSGFLQEDGQTER